MQVERQTLVRQVSLLESEVEAARNELQNYSANDPERYEALREILIVHSFCFHNCTKIKFFICFPSCFAEQAAKVALDSSNRWTDNIFTLQTWIKKKFPGMEGQLEGFFKQVGIEDRIYLHLGVPNNCGRLQPQEQNHRRLNLLFFPPNYAAWCG